MIAIEIAKHLFGRGNKINLLSLIDAVVSDRCADAPYPGRAALFYGVSSWLNPRRLFRLPQLGLKKLFPRGLRMEALLCDHGQFFDDDIAPELVNGLDAALAWSRDSRDVLAPMVGGALLNTAYRARIAVRKMIGHAEIGEKLKLNVRITNRGSVAWRPSEASGIMLGNHWLG